MKLFWEEYRTLKNGNKIRAWMEADSDKLFDKINAAIEKGEQFQEALKESVEEIALWQEHVVDFLNEQDYQTLQAQKCILEGLLKMLRDVHAKAEKRVKEAEAIYYVPHEDTIIGDDPFA